MASLLAFETLMNERALTTIALVTLALGFAVLGVCYGNRDAFTLAATALAGFLGWLNAPTPPKS